MPRPNYGTSGATSGPHRTTWRTPSFKVRLVGFGLAVMVFAFLIVRFDTKIWQAQERLREGFAAIKAEKFYFGANFRFFFRKLTATLLDFYRTGNADDLATFHHDAAELKDWLRSKELSLVAPAQRIAFSRLEPAYDEFLGGVDQMLRRGAGPKPGPEGFAAAYSEIRKAAEPVLRASEDVVGVEHGEFNVFLQHSDQALWSLQRVLLLSLLMLVALALALAVLVYRGMIAPLRASLSASQTIIERQEKLASLGALGAGVAHEIRNPLTAIKFRLFSLKKSLAPDFANNEDARVISEEIDRLDHIVKDFLQFARPTEPELVRIPADRILKGVQDLMKAELEPAAIELRLDVVQPAWVQADTAQLRQVLINLVQNSADSIGRHGRVTLRLTRSMANLEGRDRPAAILAVLDTGKGIPAEVQKRLFDPFFTTKEGGTGLGLAIAARIVEKHGGLLRYQTETDHGTVFEIVLPALDDHAS